MLARGVLSSDIMRYSESTSLTIRDCPPDPRSDWPLVGERHELDVGEFVSVYQYAWGMEASQ